MKEIKKFFDENIKLNKGYGIPLTSKKNKLEVNNKISEILPSAEILSEYEEIYPGTLAKILEFTRVEQTHRHQLELKNFEKSQNLVILAKNLSYVILLTIIISLIGICWMFTTTTLIIIATACVIFSVTKNRLNRITLLQIVKSFFSKKLQNEVKIHKNIPHKNAKKPDNIISDNKPLSNSYNRRKRNFKKK